MLSLSFLSFLQMLKSRIFLGKNLNCSVSSHTWRKKHPKFGQKIHLANFWKMRARHPTKHFKKLLIVDKARILSWRKKGVSVASITDHLGRHRSSIKYLLAKARDLLAGSIPERKKVSEQPCVINSYVCLEGA
jgi:hypothetical protein